MAHGGTWWYMVVLFVFSSVSLRFFLGFSSVFPRFLLAGCGRNDAKARLGVVVARAIFVSVHVGLA